jgi:glutamine synthetase
MTELPDLTGIDWVHLSFVDLFGVGHAFHLPGELFPGVVEHGTPFDGSALEGAARSLEADMLLVADTATLRRLGDGIARVVCTAHTPSGQPWAEGDPRVALMAAVERFDELAEAYTVAAELEFYLLDEHGEPADGGGYYDDREAAGTAVARAAATALMGCGVPVDGVHHEAGPGQYEIDLGSLSVVELADALVLAKQLVFAEAAAVGLTATFLPRPLDRRPGSGLHIHQRSPELLGTTDGDLTEAGRSFVAGQLSHAKALCALGAPTVNSYRRLHSSPEAPGEVVWARHNRGALIRVSSYQGREGSIEYRGADPSANPYLLLAAMMAAGVDGIESDLELTRSTEEDSIGGYDPAVATTRFDPLPRDLDAALDALADDDVLSDTFDPHLLRRLIDGRRGEAASHRSRVSPFDDEA